MYQAANTPAAFTSAVALSQRCFSTQRMRNPCSVDAASLQQLHNPRIVPKFKVRAAEVQIFLHFIAVGEDDEQPIFPATRRPLVCSSS